MAFTNNRIDFFEKESYTEILHAFSLVKGLVNVVKEGLDLEGTTLTNGYYANGGVLGQLGNDGETMEITPNFTGFIVIKSTLNGVASTGEIMESDTYLSTPLSDKSNVKYFTIYELENGGVINDYRYRNFINAVEVVDLGDDQFAIKINDEISNSFNTSTIQNAYSKSESDNRYERAISVNKDYANADLVDMNMAEIINKLIEENLGGYGAGVIVGTASATTLPALRTALHNLVEEIYGINLTASSLNFRFEMPGANANGGQELVVSTNQDGEYYYLDYDNHGTNYLTENADAFVKSKKNFGTTNINGHVAINGDWLEFTPNTAGYNYRTFNLDDSVTANYDGMMFQYRDRESMKLRMQAGTNEEGERYMQVSGDFAASGDRAYGIYSIAGTGLLDQGLGLHVAHESTRLLAEVQSLETKITMQQQIDLQSLQIEALANGRSIDNIKISKVESEAVKALKTKLKAVKEQLQDSQYLDEIQVARGNLMNATERKKLLEVRLKREIEEGHLLKVALTENEQLKVCEQEIEDAERNVNEIKNRYGKE